MTTTVEKIGDDTELERRIAELASSVFFSGRRVTIEAPADEEGRCDIIATISGPDLGLLPEHILDRQVVCIYGDREGGIHIQTLD